MRNNNFENWAARQPLHQRQILAAYNRIFQRPKKLAFKMAAIQSSPARKEHSRTQKSKMILLLLLICCSFKTISAGGGKVCSLLGSGWCTDTNGQTYKDFCGLYQDSDCVLDADVDQTMNDRYSYCESLCKSVPECAGFEVTKGSCLSEVDGEAVESTSIKCFPILNTVGLDATYSMDWCVNEDGSQALLSFLGNNTAVSGFTPVEKFECYSCAKPKGYRTCNGNSPQNFVSVDFIFEMETDMETLPSDLYKELRSTLFEAILDSIVDSACGSSFGQPNQQWQIIYATTATDLEDTPLESCNTKVDKAKSCASHLGKLLIGHNGSNSDVIETQVKDVILQTVSTEMESGLYTDILNGEMGSWVTVTRLSYLGFPIYETPKKAAFTLTGKILIGACTFFLVLGCFGCWYINRFVIGKEHHVSRTILDNSKPKSQKIDEEEQRRIQELTDKAYLERAERDIAAYEKQKGYRTYSPGKKISREENLEFGVKRKTVDHAGRIRNEIEL